MMTSALQGNVRIPVGGRTAIPKLCLVDGRGASEITLMGRTPAKLSEALRPQASTFSHSRQEAQKPRSLIRFMKPRSLPESSLNFMGLS